VQESAAVGKIATLGLYTLEEGTLTTLTAGRVRTQFAGGDCCEEESHGR
jgi:hypothetical protein